MTKEDLQLALQGDSYDVEEGRAGGDTMARKKPRCAHHLTAGTWEYMQTAIQSIATVLSAMVAICWLEFVWTCKSDDCLSSYAALILYTVSSTAYYISARIVIDRTLDNAARTRLCHRLVEEGVIIQHEKSRVPLTLPIFLIIAFSSAAVFASLHKSSSFEEFQSFGVSVVSQTFSIILVLLRVAWFEQSHVSVLELFVGKSKSELYGRHGKGVDASTLSSHSGSVPLSDLATDQTKGYDSIKSPPSSSTAHTVGDTLSASSTEFLLHCNIVEEKYVVGATIEIILDRVGSLGVWCQPMFLIDVAEIAEKALEMQRKQIPPEEAKGLRSQNFLNRLTALTASPSLLTRKATFADPRDDHFAKIWRRMTIVIYFACGIAYIVTQFFSFFRPLLQNIAA